MWDNNSHLESLCGITEFQSGGKTENPMLLISMDFLGEGRKRGFQSQLNSYLSKLSEYLFQIYKFVKDLNDMMSVIQENLYDGLNVRDADANAMPEADAIWPKPMAEAMPMPMP
ncbi:hypothetical protein Tco_1514772 [Tanacetum coccineum]